MTTNANVIRTVRIEAHDGYRYTLTMTDSGTYDARGQTRIGYVLKVKAPESGRKAYTVLFRGDDFSGSPMHADDSDETVAGLFGFLTLKPGDTDQDYFESYSVAQLAWAESHAEALQLACMDRFGEDA